MKDGEGSTLRDANANPARACVAGLDLLIFDFDGTLADSQELLVGLVLRSLADAGLPAAIPPAAIARLIGLPLVEVLATSSGRPPSSLAEVVKLYRRHADEDEVIASFRLFPGVSETLRILAGEGKQLTIATSKNRRITQRIVEAVGLGDLIGEIVGGDSVVCGKPHPEAVERVLALTGCPAARAAVVGDTTFDIEMGKGAGVHTIAATYGMHDHATLAALEPDVFIADIRELGGSA